MSFYIADEQREPVDLDSLQQLAEMVLAEEGYPPDTEATLLLVSDDEIASYNDRFMGRPGPTDVLAFPIERLIPGVAPEQNRYGPPLALGDVIVAPSYVQQRADSLEVAFEDELALLVTHGILHLLGYDHEADDDAERMERRESELLAKVGRTRR